MGAVSVDAIILYQKVKKQEPLTGKIWDAISLGV